MTSRGVQTQLTEERVRSRANYERKRGEHGPHDALFVALADAYLAQQRVIEAARDLQRICSRKGLGAAVASTPEKFRLDAALAAVSVGSPETRETEE